MGLSLGQIMLVTERKASQIHMSRLLAAELATDQIRVNTVNPDGVIIGSKKSGRAEGSLWNLNKGIT